MHLLVAVSRGHVTRNASLSQRTVKAGVDMPDLLYGKAIQNLAGIIAL